MKIELKYLEKNIDPEAWLEEVISTHFDPELGTAYWLKKEKELGIDARKDIVTIDDLGLLGPMDEDALRYTPAEDLVPRKFLGKNSPKSELYLYTTGGTTGVPKISIFSEEFKDAQMKGFKYASQKFGLPHDEDILYIGPTGPTSIGAASNWVAEELNGWVYKIHLDTLWIKKVQDRMMNGDKLAGEELGRYMTHMMEQAMLILKTQKPGILFTTAKILEILVEKLPGSAIENLELKGIFHVGMALSPESYKMLKEEVYKNIPIMGIYGNSLWGGAFQMHPVDGNNVDYSPTFPYIIFEIVDQDKNPAKYGERGQVMFHRLTPEYLIANLFERDEANKLKPSEDYGWPCVRNPDIIHTFKGKIASGVY